MDDEMDDVSSAYDEEEPSTGGDDGSDIRSESEGTDADDGLELGDFDTKARGRLARADIAKDPAHLQLAKWHDTLLPFEVDLITELDATNLFFINVESVIFDLISSKEIDFEGDPQFLRLIYLMEQTFRNIRDSGGVFRLVFFDGMKKLFSAAFGESVWAFREGFLLHCRTTGMDHIVFPDWYCAEYKEHVQEWSPAFFLLANDAVELEDEEEGDEEDDDEKAKLRGLFHSLMLRCLSFRTHVALLRGLQRRGNRIMAFALEPDTYDGFIDRNAKESLSELLAPEEDEEDDGEELVPAIKKFQKSAGANAPSSALLRTFFTSRFGKQTLKMAAGQNEAGAQLMQLVVKSLALHEMMIRYIPVDKRAIGTVPAGEWDFFDEKIASGALGNFFSMISSCLHKLTTKDELPEDLELQASDLFDGRLYRHIFHFLVDKGIAGKGKVEKDKFGFKEWLQQELDFIWKETGSKDAFFPINMKALLEIPDLKPPSLPGKDKPRSTPELSAVESEFFTYMRKGDDEISHITLVEATDQEISTTLQEKHGWATDVQLDLLKEEERMEKSAAQKKMEAYTLQRGGKVTERDIEYKRKFELKRRQLALRALTQYAKSLTGSNRLHPPIIMKEDSAKDKKSGEQDKPAEQKISKKQQEILEAQKIKEQLKIAEHEKSQTEEWDKKIAPISDIIDLDKLENTVLDLLLGYNRITDSFVGFPALASSFKTSEAQAKIVVKFVKAIKASFKKMKLDKLPADDQPKVRRMARYLFSIIQEAMNSFCKNDLDGRGIKQFQEALLCMGFKVTAEKMFEMWKEAQVAKAEKEKAAAEASAPAKGGKDDKKGKADDKKGKEKEKEKEKDKKDKKEKDDKKDKKSKKDGKDDDDGDGEKDLDSYKVKTDKEDKYWSGVGDDEYAFQLRFLGPYMTRTVGTGKDPKNRVNFKPDGWQRNLLDIVDSERSALVVAPTASGKTFIGYYVMDKVLRSDNEGVAVYVAPSKTLVNQVSAEIYARFSSKTYPANCKSELLGVFLREYNSCGGVAEAGKWKNCQVLVTIPHILEMLLTSPSHQEWVKRLRYVVFDEVHCIGGEDGTQWEHSMQIIPCPFIALSATVADPSFFHSWLSRVNKKKEQADVEIVIHTERWNDLYKYYWRKGELRPLHPFCCLVEKNVRLQGLSSDLTLTPEEMVQLFQELSKIIGKSKSWDVLAPESYFAKKCGFIRKADARVWEKELKSTFLDLMKDGTIDSEVFHKLKLALQEMPSAIVNIKADAKAIEFKPPTRVEDGDDAEEKESPDAPFNLAKMPKSNSYLQASTLVPLIRTLDELQYLPAIVFNFARKDIERMVKTLVTELKDQQHYKYYGTEEANYKSKRIMEKRLSDYQNKLTAYEQAQKMLASKNQEGAAARKAAGDDEGRGARNIEAVDVSMDANMPPPPPPVDLMDEIDMEFSFHSPKALGQWAEDIEETLASLKSRKTLPSYLVDGLRRGIGMHHEGAQKQYREAVEILFRRGYLRIVFGTGTLALGINMPCRSTIFCGDSLELSGLMYRQMAGRAGRRGFDLLGQVVFLDMSYLKIQRLVASDLSTLTGEFSLSPTMLLRVLHEWEQVSLDEEQGKELFRSKGDIARVLAPMFCQPFFENPKAELETQVAYHTRYSLELLYDQGLIGPNGYTSGLASLVTMLFETEPANFLLARLLSTGLLHQYLQKESKKVKKGERRTHLTVKLVAVLSWLFYRRRLPSVIPSERKHRKKHHPSEFSPKLPPLPAKIEEEVMAYNQGLFDHFQSLAWSVGSTRKMAETDLQLPISEQQFNVKWDKRGEPFPKESDFGGRYRLIRYRARSPFSAIGGIGDTFLSQADLAKSARSVMHLDIHSFMTVACPLLGEDGLEPTNSWMLDFMIHGKKEYLWEDNGINATLAWKLISDFLAAVKKAVTALKAYCPEDDLVLTTFAALGAEIEEYHLGGKKA